MKKSIRELNRLAARYGFEPAAHLRSGHLKFRHTQTGTTVFHGSSTSDKYARRALEAEFKKIELNRETAAPIKKRQRGGER